MKITVYADVLFVTNFVINYILLYITSILSGKRHSVPRLIAASVIGAIYAVCMFLPGFSPAGTIAGKLILSLGICVVAFGITPAKSYVKKLGFFYAVSLLCGGIVTALVSVGNSSVANINNGIIYFNTDIYTIIISAVITYLVIRFTYGVYRRYATRNLYRMTVCKNGHAVSLSVLMDTGNMLWDPMSGASVIVVEKDAVKALIPESGPEDDIFDIAHHISDVRLIPYKTIDNDNGLLVGFKPDKIYCSTPLKDDVVIGISSKKLGTDGEYNALAGPDSFA